jgi:hypothetical protein
VSSLYLGWQYAVTGDPFLNPYLLWWPYDKIGFGPGVGRIAGGHNLVLAWFQTRFSLDVGSHDLFGWPYLSYLFLPFGLIAGRKKGSMWLAASVPLSLVVLYSLYWTPAWLYGPRYYFEGISSAAVISAAGIRWLGASRAAPENQPQRRQAWGWPARLRFGLTTLLVTLLLTGDLLFYLPQRLGMMKGMYNVAAADLAPFRTPEARAMPPTLVIVHIQKYWIEYGRLLDLSSPLFTSQFVFTISRGDELDNQVMSLFPDRIVWQYYPGGDLPVSQPAKPKN